MDNVFPGLNGVKYRIGKRIDEGSFGVVYEGEMLSGRESVPVALKFEPRKTAFPQLRDEYRNYTLLKGRKGIPRVYYFGRLFLHDVLVIDLLGESLEQRFCRMKFSLETVVSLAQQMLLIIEGVHKSGLVYRDIKADNFLFGRPGIGAETIHLIDLGLAKKYRDPETKQHIPYREGRSLTGTARYMSINTHLGREQSRRDDMEALGHVWVYFLRGRLPWQGIKAESNAQKYELIGKKKQETPINDLCEGFPKEFAVYLEYVRGLGFEDPPNYEYLRDILRKAGENAGHLDVGQFDWMEVGNARPKKLEMR
ncbi:Casein kinase I-like protein [Pleurostoma richardsiae]|uniref:non-specific serine/threonine protein kinase n=1 Tax=Pleurostoma richardsiae TaxID=41990 RepID=A0AA38R7M2_9PEZI|nr:Casein kinase I-like protein [Pleurostoma richardsiae]